jgi:transposase InsO family protein
MAGERTGAALKNYRDRYRKLGREGRGKLLDEFCAMTNYGRKYAIFLLNKVEEEPRQKALRGPTYSAAALRVVGRIWEAAGYPSGERLVAMLPQWLPWARRQMPELTPEVEAQVLRISARQIDRRLKDRKREKKRRLYSHTKPGTLLRHTIEIRTEHWDVQEPGHVEIDLVAHCGPSASGAFLYSLNLTDIHTGWCETRAIMGKGETGVVAALDEMRRALPFALKSIDSDNGSEFINYHLQRWCKKQGIRQTRSRPYKKNDNAHIEQKNWTHVRKILGWDRYDTPEQQAAINALYAGPVSIMMNHFQASAKLLSKHREGAKLSRRYSPCITPLNRLLQSQPVQTPALSKAQSTCEKTDPFLLDQQIRTALKAITLSTRKAKPSAA